MPKKRANKRKWTLDETHYTEDDALILVMGPSGCGKSTFINQIMGEEVAKVTHDFNPCTLEVKAYGCERNPSPDVLDSPKQRVVLVDTPGFFGGDSEMSDLAILTQISEWLRPKHGKERYLTGIVYLHDMTQKRIVRETKMSLSLFQQICGADSCAQTVLVKTQWPRPIDRQSLARSRDLDNDFFREMQEAGATFMDIREGHQSEKDVIDHILRRDVAKNMILKLQEELQEGKPLASTGAGKELKKCLMELLMFTDPGSQKEQIAAMTKTIRELSNHPSLRKRIMGWFSRKVIHG